MSEFASSGHRRIDKTDGGVIVGVRYTVRISRHGFWKGRGGRGAWLSRGGDWLDYRYTVCGFVGVS